MTVSDMKKSLLDAGRKHFALCLKVSAESRSMSDALDQAVSSLPIESLRKAATGRDEASWLIYAAPEAQIEGYPYTGHGRRNSAHGRAATAGTVRHR